MTQNATVEDVKRYALDHYDEGGDAILLCWGDDKIKEALDEGLGFGFIQFLMSAWACKLRNSAEK